MTDTFTLPVNQLSALVTFSAESPITIDENKVLDELVSRFSFTVVKKVSHDFVNGGRTIVYILSQSHLILHTWPEYHLFHIDLVSCTNVSKVDLEKALVNIFKNTKFKSIKVQSMAFS